MTRLTRLAAMLLALGGCPSVGVAPEGRPCETDEHCGSGTVCDPATKTCVKQGAVDQLPPGDGPLADTTADGDGDAAMDGPVDVAADAAPDLAALDSAPDLASPDGAPDAGGDTSTPDGAADLPTTCGPGTCQGCCQGNVCIGLAAQSAPICGQGGQPCQSCDDGEGCTTESCAQGACTFQNKTDGTTCDDKDDCTYDDQCTGGVCGGTEDKCSDGLTCTADTCTGLAPPAHCVNPLLSGHCLIGTFCAADSDLQAGNACNQCDSSIAASIWTAASGCTSTLAGSGTEAWMDGALLSAAFDDPVGIAIDPSGKVYVSDRDTHTIRVISADKVTTLAGTGTAGYQDGPAATAMFNEPHGLALDSAGALYVADKQNHRIRKIANGVVSTFAGTGVSGSVDGPATSVARFNDPFGVAVDAAGTVYVAGNDDNKIRKIAAGTVSTLAGTGTAGYLDGPAAQAMFDTPQGVAVDGSGAVFATDLGNNRIRKIVGGVVSTVAGSGPPQQMGFVDGPVATARLGGPLGIVLDGSTIYFVEEDPGNNAVRKIAGGVVTTLAGGTVGSQNGPLASSLFNDPQFLALHDGVLYIVDHDNQRIRLLRP